MKTVERLNLLSHDTWNRFVREYNLSEIQQEQFAQYADLLMVHSEQINLTTRTALDEIITDHFQDSIELINHMDMNTINSLVDVGTGAGFPGIPLKIIAPHLAVQLLEVTQKKRIFLQHVVDLLELSAVQVIGDDWRTHLRHAQYVVDVVVFRASLPIDELLRMFSPQSIYKNSLLIYWSAQAWQPNTVQRSFICADERYTVGDKIRRYVFFRAQE